MNLTQMTIVSTIVGKNPLVAIVVNKRVQNTVQFTSVAQSCPTLCDPMNGSKPGLPVHHQLPESTQTHIVNTPKTGMGCRFKFPTFSTR